MKPNLQYIRTIVLFGTQWGFLRTFMPYSKLKTPYIRLLGQYCSGNLIENGCKIMASQPSNATVKMHILYILELFLGLFLEHTQSR